MSTLASVYVRWRAVFEGVRDAVFVLDRSGRLLSANPAFRSITGWSEADCLGRTLMEALPAEDRAQASTLLAAALESAEAVPVEIRLQGVGGLHLLQGRATPLQEERAPAILVVAADVTEGRRLGEELRHAQRMEALGRLAGGVAHDFNNLLTIINGYAEILAAELHESSLGGLAREVSAASERAAALTRQLLAFSRRQPLDPKVIDFDGVVRDMERLLRRLIGEDVALATRLEAGLACVRLDRAQLEQILLNLAVNARDAMPAGGSLSVSTSIAESGEAASVHLDVSDTGIGMDACTRTHLFEPYFTTKAPGEGAGLGLATVYGIVQQAGGTIEVRSEPGAGATFQLRLPVVPAELRSGEGVRAEAVPAAGAGAARGTILVAEDDDAVRGLVRRVLEDEGYQVLEARDGREAATIADAAATLDVLLTDVVMPGGLTGVDLARDLAQRHPGLRVLFMTGYPPETAQRYGLPTAAGVLQKPLNTKALLAAVRGGRGA